MFKQFENEASGFQLALDDALRGLRWNDDGLIAVIAQQHDSGEVLMMAWMNEEALRETLATGRVCYYSRSRKTLWRKGETSNQVQTLVELRADCDGDVLLAKVDQTGAACHTGRRDCFFWKLDEAHASIDRTPLIAPEDLYQK